MKNFFGQENLSVSMVFPAFLGIAAVIVGARVLYDAGKKTIQYTAKKYREKRWNHGLICRADNLGMFNNLSFWLNNRPRKNMGIYTSFIPHKTDKSKHKRCRLPMPGKWYKYVVAYQYPWSITKNRIIASNVTMHIRPYSDGKSLTGYELRTSCRNPKSTISNFLDMLEGTYDHDQKRFTNNSKNTK